MCYVHAVPVDSESFGIEKGHGQRLVDWMNEQAGLKGLRFEARLYGYDLETDNFGAFEMFSWRGDVQGARRLVIRASKRFKVRVIEGGYKTKERTFNTRRSDYGMVRRGSRVIGHIELEASRFSREKWRITREERR